MESLVNPKEKIYLSISFTVSLAMYFYLGLSLVGTIYVVVAAILLLLLHGLSIGHLRGNGIMVSERQFPEVYRIASQLASQMELSPIPTIYVIQAGGLLNAFATRFLGRDFVVIYSDVLELAYEKGESELAFVICHELAHIHRKHLFWRWFLYPAMTIPFLGGAYSRACEYTCDSYGAHYRPDGAVGGLMVLAAGKRLYRNVNTNEYSNQADTERGFWISFAEALSSHPNLPKRLKALGLSPVSTR